MASIIMPGPNDADGKPLAHFSVPRVLTLVWHLSLLNPDPFQGKRARGQRWR